MKNNNMVTTIDFLNKLLEAERAGVKVLRMLVSLVEDEKKKDLIRRFLHDEGMNCQILKTIIENAGYTISPNTGDFVQKIESLPGIEEKIELLLKGQEWVARQIRRNREIKIKVSERMLLEAIKIQHEENVDALRASIG